MKKLPIRNILTQIRWTADERKALTRKAREARLTVSAYVRVKALA